MTKIFLGFSALAWAGYGAFCFFQPGYLSEAAGVAAASRTGLVELRAMYGGLQIAIGILAAVGLAHRAFERPALVALGFLCAGLGASRTIAAALEAEASAYTVFAILFELASAAIAARLLTVDNAARR